MPKCHCNSCTVWSPIIRKVQKKLCGKLAKDFELWLMSTACREMDGYVAMAKLEGSWPDWEWLPAEIERRNKLSENLRNKSNLSATGTD